MYVLSCYNSSRNFAHMYSEKAMTRRTTQRTAVVEYTHTVADIFLRRGSRNVRITSLDCHLDDLSVTAAFFLLARDLSSARSVRKFYLELAPQRPAPTARLHQPSTNNIYVCNSSLLAPAETQPSQNNLCQVRSLASDVTSSREKTAADLHT